MKHKRIGSLITACLLSAALITGCGGGSTATSTSGPDESAKNTAVTEESEVAENADPAEAADSIDVPAAAIDCSFELDGKKYTVLGSPNLGKVKVIMVGVRNPKKESLGDGNNMLPKSAIVWVNELRLSDYTNKGGWAAMAMARTNLADLGNLTPSSRRNW